MIKPVIMAGGTGSRLWPLSRKLMPKQFLKIDSHNTLIQQTVLRLKGLNVSSPITICNEEHRFIVAEQMREINQLGSIILEPVGRNTAPAIALAALSELNAGRDPILLVLAADHAIGNTKAFQQVVTNAEPLAEAGHLVTFGIVPQHPETGYGYIRHGHNGLGCGFMVEEFVEKPDLPTAKQYLASGQYLWNSGMFMFKASRYIEELTAFQPDIVMACQSSLSNKTHDLDFIRVNKQRFSTCPSDSIDYAVMEKTESAVVVPLDANWNDIGSFTAIWDLSEKDENGNVHQGDVIDHKSENTLVIAEQKLVTTVGLKDCIVVETKDAVLVADKNHIQDVKKIVEKIHTLNRKEADVHRQVYRPWGYYDAIDFGASDQVKRITVNPGKKISVQRHEHRAEHWIVVAGKAKITKADKTFILAENQSTYIAAGETHALENPGVLPLQIIEVQTGRYIGEDDIVRFDELFMGHE